MVVIHESLLKFRKYFLVHLEMFLQLFSSEETTLFTIYTNIVIFNFFYMQSKFLKIYFL